MISQLIEKKKKTNAPICVGLDPMLSYVPEHVVKEIPGCLRRDTGGGCRCHLAV